MNIAIYIYDNAEVLDFSGPFEVLSTAKRLGNKDWNIFLISETSNLVQARGGFPIKAHYSFADHPCIDLLIVVGGVHTEEVNKPKVISWIADTASKSSKVVSVCTGAFLLAEAGLLDGLKVTTHWEDIDDLTKAYPLLQVISGQRWVSDKKYTTSGGISAGIDMSLYLVSQMDSLILAEKTAKQMEYRWEKSMVKY